MRCSFLLDASWRTVNGATPSKDNNNVDLRAHMGVHLDTTRPFYFKEGFCITQTSLKQKHDHSTEFWSFPFSASADVGVRCL